MAQSFLLLCKEPKRLIRLMIKRALTVSGSIDLQTGPKYKTLTSVITETVIKRSLQDEEGKAEEAKISVSCLFLYFRSRK